MSVTAIITAGGSGLRLGGDIPKQFRFMGGKPILARTLSAFEHSDIIKDIIVTAPADYLPHTREIVDVYGFNKVRAVVPGGDNRAASIYAALMELSSFFIGSEAGLHTVFKVPLHMPRNIVIIHDGVRPFVTDRLIRAVAEAARTRKAAIAGIPLTDTIKEVDDRGQVASTPDRKRFWRVQTPQAFTYELIIKAYTQGEKAGILPQVTDDSMLVERLGVPVTMVHGDTGNIKITTAEDMAHGELLLQFKS